MIVDEIFSPYKNEATGMWSIRTFNDYEERPTKGKPWSVNSSEKKKESSPLHSVADYTKIEKISWTSFMDSLLQARSCHYVSKTSWNSDQKLIKKESKRFQLITKDSSRIQKNPNITKGSTSFQKIFKNQGL